MKRMGLLFVYLMLGGLLLAAANIVADLWGSTRLERIANAGRVACFMIGMGAVGIILYKRLWLSSRQRTRTLRAADCLCANCGYDLTGNLSGVCPECGEPVEEIKTRNNERSAAGDSGQWPSH